MAYMEAGNGGVISEGCIRKTCKNGVWRSSLDSMICCYEGKPYSPGSSVATVLSEDGCGAAHHHCQLQDGQAVLLLTVDNRCSEYATQEQASEIRSLIEKYLEIKC